MSNLFKKLLKNNHNFLDLKSLSRKSNMKPENETASAVSVSWDQKSHSESKYKEVIPCFIAI